jgi:hypothetical protein
MFRQQTSEDRLVLMAQASVKLFEDELNLFKFLIRQTIERSDNEIDSSSKAELANITNDELAFSWIGMHIDQRPNPYRDYEHLPRLRTTLKPALFGMR